MEKFYVDIWKWDVEHHEYYQTTIKSFRHEADARGAYKKVTLSKNRIAKELWKITEKDNIRLANETYEGE